MKTEKKLGLSERELDRVILTELQMKGAWGRLNKMGIPNRRITKAICNEKRMLIVAGVIWLSIAILLLGYTLYLFLI